MTTSNIHTTVMRRVRTIHALQALLGGAGISFLVIATSLYVIGREVWVARVFENMPNMSDVFAVSRFFLHAFESTDMAVQLLMLVTIAASIWLIREIVRVLQPLQFA